MHEHDLPVDEETEPEQNQAQGPAQAASEATQIQEVEKTDPES